MVTIKRNAKSVTVNGKRCVYPWQVMDELITSGISMEASRELVAMARKMETGAVHEVR